MRHEPNELVGHVVESDDGGRGWCICWTDQPTVTVVYSDGTERDILARHVKPAVTTSPLTLQDACHRRDVRRDIPRRIEAFIEWLYQTPTAMDNGNLTPFMVAGILEGIIAPGSTPEPMAARERRLLEEGPTPL